MPNQTSLISRELLSHQGFLRRLATDLVGQDADDLVQDVWQRALERPPNSGDQLRGWLARVARNLVVNRWRGEARRAQRERAIGERDSCDKQRSAQAETDELEDRLALRKELVGALDSLNQSGRETILLRYFEDLSPSDIASRQGVPLATVKTRLRRGLSQLREILDKRYDGERTFWMSAITTLSAPIGGGSGTSILSMGVIIWEPS